MKTLDRLTRSLREDILLGLVCLAAFLLAPRSRGTDAQPCCGQITPAGHRLAESLDNSNVESLWLAQEHVNWETGKPDRGGEDEGPGFHTHCSAFAAAMAKRLGVYLLRPPEHGQRWLANAQARWLASEDGKRKGWLTLDDPGRAQAEANRGNLAVVVFENPDPRQPGHIAILRPSEKSRSALANDGPEIIQAGQHNHQSTVVRIGFHNHPGAFPDGVRYYTHEIVWSR
jgi:hypothetical protein